MIAPNLLIVFDMHDLPIVLDPARMDEDVGIEETLRRNKAQYHQSCRLMFNNTKLERARKIITGAQNANDVQDCTKLRRANQEHRKSHCFLCGEQEPVSERRQFITMHLNQRQNDCAQKLNDGWLLAKLSVDVPLYRSSSTTLHVWRNCTEEKDPTCEAFKAKNRPGHWNLTHTR